MLVVRKVIRKVNDRTIVEMACDDATDVQALSAYALSANLQMGSTCYCIGEGATYVMKSDMTWVRKTETYSSMYLGVTTTALVDGATTNPIVINGSSVSAASGNIALYGAKEFIFNGTTWQEFGDLSGLGALAYKSSASGTFTPAGTVSNNLTTDTVKSVTSVGVLPTLTVVGETLTYTEGELPETEDKTVVTDVTSTFTGTADTVTVQ